jgi:hypothetical protein
LRKGGGEKIKAEATEERCASKKAEANVAQHEPNGYISGPFYTSASTNRMGRSLLHAFSPLVCSVASQTRHVPTHEPSLLVSLSCALHLPKYLFLNKKKICTNILFSNSTNKHFPVHTE